tara:strand:- start:235 stop:483 length:249 start_codon:yes stop_codon:yes gene_type:complete
MEKSEKYVISEGVFDWLLKTLAGKDRAARIKFYSAIKGDRTLTKLSKELEQKIADMKKAMKKSHYDDPNFDIDQLKRLQRGL